MEREKPIYIERMFFITWSTLRAEHDMKKEVWIWDNFSTESCPHIKCQVTLPHIRWLDRILSLWCMREIIIMHTHQPFPDKVRSRVMLQSNLKSCRFRVFFITCDSEIFKLTKIRRRRFPQLAVYLSVLMSCRGQGDQVESWLKTPTHKPGTRHLSSDLSLLHFPLLRYLLPPLHLVCYKFRHPLVIYRKEY